MLFMAAVSSSTMSLVSTPSTISAASRETFCGPRMCEWKIKPATMVAALAGQSTKTSCSSSLPMKASTPLTRILGAPGTAPRVAAVLTPSCADVNGPCQVVPGGLDLGSPFPAGSGPGNPYLPLKPTVGGAFIGNGFDGVPDIMLAQLVYPNPRTGNQYHARVDWNVNNKHTVALSTFLTSATSTNPPGSDQTSAANRDVINKPFSPAGTVLWNWIISPTTLNEVRLNFSRFAFDEVSSNQGAVNW